MSIHFKIIALFVPVLLLGCQSKPANLHEENSEIQIQREVITKNLDQPLVKEVDVKAESFPSEKANELILKAKSGDTNLLKTKDSNLSYRQNLWQRGAILKKDYNPDIWNPISEHEASANIQTEEGDKIGDGSLFYLTGKLEHKNSDTINLQQVSIEGFLRDESGLAKMVEVDTEPFHEQYDLRIILDSDELPLGTYQACLWIHSNFYDFESIDCSTLIRGESPITFSSEYDEHELEYHISPEGYYVEFGDIKYYYPGLGVERYRYAENDNYIIVEPAMNEWREAVIINSNTGRVIENTIQFDSIWKEIDGGYRIYTCSRGIFSDHKIEYIDLKVADDHVVVTPLGDEQSACLLKEDHLILAESTGPQSVNYSEYDIQTDQWVRGPELIQLEEDFYPEDHNMEEFYEKYISL